MNLAKFVYSTWQWDNSLLQLKQTNVSWGFELIIICFYCQYLRLETESEF